MSPPALLISDHSSCFSVLREWRRFRSAGGRPELPHFLRWLRRHRRLHYVRFPAAPGFLLWWLRVGRHRFGGRWPEGIQAYDAYELPEIDILVPEYLPDQKRLYLFRNYPGLLQSWGRKYDPETLSIWWQENRRFASRWHKPSTPSSFDARQPRTERGPTALYLQWWQRRPAPRHRDQWFSENQEFQIGSQEFPQPLRVEQISEALRIPPIQWWQSGGTPGINEWQLQGNQQPNTGGQGISSAALVTQQRPLGTNRRLGQTLPFFYLQQGALNPRQIIYWRQADIGPLSSWWNLYNKWNIPEARKQKPAFFTLPGYENFRLRRGKLASNLQSLLRNQGRQPLISQPNDAFLRANEWQGGVHSLRMTPGYRIMWKQGTGIGRVMQSPENYEGLQEYREPSFQLPRSRYGRDAASRHAYLLWLRPQKMQRRSGQLSPQPTSTYQFSPEYHRRTATEGFASPLGTRPMGLWRDEAKPSLEIEPDTQRNRRPHFRRGPENIESAPSFLWWRAGNQPEIRLQGINWNIPVSRETNTLQGGQQISPLQIHSMASRWLPEAEGVQKHYPAFVRSLREFGAQETPTFQQYFSNVPWQMRGRRPGSVNLWREAEQRGGPQNGRNYIRVVQRRLNGVPAFWRQLNRESALDLQPPFSAYRPAIRTEFTYGSSPYGVPSGLQWWRRQRAPSLNFRWTEGGQAPQAQQRNPWLRSTEEQNNLQDRAFRAGFRHVPQRLNRGISSVGIRWQRGHREPPAPARDAYGNWAFLRRVPGRQPIGMTSEVPVSSQWGQYELRPGHSGQLYEIMRRPQTKKEPTTGRVPYLLTDALSRNGPRETTGDLFWWQQAERFPKQMYLPQAPVTTDFNEQFLNPHYQYKFYRQPEFWLSIQTPKQLARGLQSAEQLFRMQGQRPMPATFPLPSRQWPPFQPISEAKPTLRHHLFWQKEPGSWLHNIADKKLRRDEEPPGYMRALYGQDKESGLWKRFPTDAVSGHPVWWVYKQIPYWWKTQCGGCAQEYGIQGMPYKVICLQVPQSVNVWQLLQRVFAGSVRNLY